MSYFSFSPCFSLLIILIQVDVGLNSPDLKTEQALFNILQDIDYLAKLNLLLEGNQWF